jgi:Mrp family chromosome partitioning ATPase
MNLALKAPPKPAAAVVPSAAVDLSAEMADLWTALGPVAPERGRVVQFVSAAAGEGTSTIAREFALYAARRARKPVWLVDLDVFGAGQQKAVARQPGRFGPLGKPAAASPDGSAFFRVVEAGDARPVSHYLSARPTLGGRLWVTRFHAEALKTGQPLVLSRNPRYWAAMRGHAEYVIIDAPAAERSTAALTLGPVADVNVLVLAAEAGDARGPAALRAALEETGANVAGFVFNRAEARPPAFLDRLL